MQIGRGRTALGQARCPATALGPIQKSKQKSNRINLNFGAFPWEPGSGPGTDPEAHPSTGTEAGCTDPRKAQRTYAWPLARSVALGPKQSHTAAVRIPKDLPQCPVAVFNVQNCAQRRRERLTPPRRAPPCACNGARRYDRRRLCAPGAAAHSQGPAAVPGSFTQHELLLKSHYGILKIESLRLFCQLHVALGSPMGLPQRRVH
jgi:hypothetical protein